MKEATDVNLACGVPKCTDRLSLHVETEHHSYVRGGGHINSASFALQEAAIHLGWRFDKTTEKIHCPLHAHDLRCARCLAGRDNCGCMGGQRWEALPADAGDAE